MGRHRVAIGLLILTAALAMVSPVGGQGDEASRAAAEPVMRQLEAFRRGDFATAYSFASQEIHHLFDRSAFEQMVRAIYGMVREQGDWKINGVVARPDPNLA